MTEAAQPAKEAPKGSARKEKLVSIEKWAQNLWEQQQAYNIDPDPSKEKFYATFPYAYMNGRLHTGHAFSMTKAEFTTRFQTLQGKQAMFPYAWHVTGMPICAAALKLRKELGMLREGEKADEPKPVAKAPEPEPVDDDPALGKDKFKGKKTKTAAKGPAAPLKQSEIMKLLNIPDDEIPKFCDEQYWIDYFCPLGKVDLEEMGFGIDWRRIFVTTDINPFYDAFIRWQFNTLKNKTEYLKFGKREAVFDPITNQPCADHDRASGEGVGCQEYTLIKQKVQEHGAKWADVVGDRPVFFVCATLRAETMCGQTNCFVLPDGEYGFFEMNNNEILVCAERSATNMVYQDMGPYDTNPSGFRVPKCLIKVKGMDLIGTPLTAPLCKYPTIYALPMLTILMNKGTGIVTSVPADSPDDYACLRDWQTKPKWREDYGVKEEWVQFEPVNIVRIPDSEFGDACAIFLCEKLKIQSHKDKEKLAVAKKESYLKGFTEGIMIAGPLEGMPVKDAKVKQRELMIADGTAANYLEPESLVMSRAGAECVVALCDQWYLDYGNEEWTERVRNYATDSLKTNTQACHKQFLHTIDWLKAWACSRTFGLGTRLPWDKNWIIESLSDSTVYFAYYTIAHYLQGGNMYGQSKGGQQPGPYKIKPEDMTDEVFNYIFGLRDDVPSDAKVEEKYLKMMRDEFHYWYPMDIRVSGKDLVTNHLTMSLFNHAAIWKDSARYWPREFYANGFVMVDNEKMSKSKGNFFTCKDLLDTYGADASRIAFADCGDTMEDANFSTESANMSVLRLTTLDDWCVKIMEYLNTNPEVPAEKSFLDQVFENELNSLILTAKREYESMQFKLALKAAWFEMDNLKSDYRVLCGEKYHPELIRRFIEVQCILMSPITPHMSEHIWGRILKNEGLCCKAKWPEISAPFDEVLHRKFTVLQSDLRIFRLSKENLAGGKKKKPTDEVRKPIGAVIYVAKEYKPFQQTCLKFLQTVPLNDTNDGPASKDYIRDLRDDANVKALTKEEQKKAMQFSSFVMTEELRIYGKDALSLNLPFDEAEMLRDRTELIKLQLGLEEVVIHDSTEPHPKDDTAKRDFAVPAKPQITFWME